MNGPVPGADDLNSYNKNNQSTISRNYSFQKKSRKRRQCLQFPILLSFLFRSFLFDVGYHKDYDGI